MAREKMDGSQSYWLHKLEQQATKAGLLLGSILKNTPSRIFCLLTWTYLFKREFVAISTCLFPIFIQWTTYTLWEKPYHSWTIQKLNRNFSEAVGTLLLFPDYSDVSTASCDILGTPHKMICLEQSSEIYMTLMKMVVVSTKKKLLSFTVHWFLIEARFE